MRKRKIEDIIEIGKENNFTLLTQEYQSSNQKLCWLCDKCNTETHRTMATIKRNGLKCTKCSTRVPWNKGQKGVSEEMLRHLGY